jgi:hypothetical protein
MDVQRAVLQLARSAAAIRALCAAPGLDVHWKPTEKKWSILEVLCHLGDEEREDFRLRLDLTLHQQEKEWPPIDPEAWVKSREYAERDPEAALADFLAERERSIAWLKGLGSPDLTKTYLHPRPRPLRAGDLLISWVNHDLLHIRQIVGLQHAWVEATSKPYESGYAGKW